MTLTDTTTSPPHPSSVHPTQSLSMLSHVASTHSHPGFRLGSDEGTLTQWLLPSQVSSVHGSAAGQGVPDGA